MIIIVKHNISDTQNFWEAAQRTLPLLPTSGVQRLIQMLPNIDMTEMTCIWEATTIASLDVFFRRKFFDWSNETYYELNLAQTIGFP